VRRALLILGFVGTALSGYLARPAGTQTAIAGLTGETLVQPGPGQPNGVLPTSYDCNPTGTSTVSFTASGNATGPYPGTFTETGTVTFGPQTNPNGFATVTSFEVEFVINSDAGTVNGTKSLAPNATTAVAFCNTVGGQIVVDAQYVATITAPTGTAIDEGRANTQFNVCPNVATCGTIGVGSAFYESFASQQLTAPTTTTTTVQPTTTTTVQPTTTTTTTLGAPSSEEQCKQGGFRSYPALGFRNQGDCVSFVRTHGKNEPGKNQPK
jgi:hypothetical protein